MDAVTTDAGGDSLLASLEQFPVHAGVVFTFLIDPQRRIKSLHQVRVAVTLATIRRDIECLWFSQIAFPRILRPFFRVGVRIAAVTVITGQTATTMNVVIKELCRRAKPRVLQLRVALNA